MSKNFLKKNIKIAPSILSADFSMLAKEVSAIDKTDAEYIHLDIMDGNFVPNITFGAQMVKTIRKYSQKIFDVHLMVNNPEKHIKNFADAGADIITIHAEATTHLDNALNMIKNLGKKSGISLNPATSPNVIDFVIDKIDLILVMSVNPGFAGQKFIESSLKKIAVINKKISDEKLNIDIEVDGGIDEKTGKLAIENGANILVAGSYIFNNKKDYATQINKLKNCTQN